MSQILSVSKIVFPLDGDPPVRDGKPFPEGAYHFPFEIAFPLLSNCHELGDGARHLTATLPPSFETQQSCRGAAKISYFLEVRVKRPGMLHRDVSTQKELVFSPPDPPLALIWSGSGPGCCAVSHTLYIDKEALPGKLPALALNIKLPSPAVLYSDETLPLQLSVWRFSIPVGDPHPVALKSLAVVLQSRTILTAENRRTSWTSHTDLLRLTGMKEALANSQDEEQVLDLGPLRTMKMSKVTPSFTTCTAKRDYRLEVIAEFKFGARDESNVWYLQPLAMQCDTNFRSCLVANQGCY